MSISVSGVGHLVLRVPDLADSLDFCEGVLGLREVARRDFGEGPMAFLSTGKAHHDVAAHSPGAAQPLTVRGKVSVGHRMCIRTLRCVPRMDGR